MTDIPNSPKVSSVHDARIGGNLIRYGLSRNVPATTASGEPAKLCLAYVERENGTQQVIAINEDLIRFMGDTCIEQEIARAIRT